MALTPAVLQSGTPLVVWTSGASTVLYTVPVSTTALVKRASFCNVTNGSVGLSIFVVRAAAPTVPIFLLNGLVIAANTPYSSAEVNGLVLKAGDSLKAQCSVDQGIIAVVSGFTL